MENNIINSEIESKRFNMKIARAKMNDISVKELNAFITKNKTDITILRIPCENLNQVYKLEQLGYPFYQTDTLVYYSTNFLKYQPQKLKNNNLEFILATNKELEIISSLIDSIFPGYTNHYSSNPFIDKRNILEGYKEWVMGFINEEEKYVFIVSQNGKNIGFASCSIENGIAEGILYGVIPEASGGGVYSDIIRYTQKFVFDRGIMEMKVSTQVQNYGVQKVWSREGFFLMESFSTIHINSLLSYTLLEEKKFNITFSEDDIENAGKLSGDLNPIHFNNEYAKSIGFEKRITHGLLANAEMSKYFGTVFPGNGTLFMGYKYKFIRPIYPNETYEVNINIPYYDVVKNIYLCVVKIYDAENNLCLIAYNDLIKR